MKIQIILEVDADELDWTACSVVPTDNGVGGALLDFDLGPVTYHGNAVDFVDADNACDYLEFLYGESDQKDYRYA